MRQAGVRQQARAAQTIAVASDPYALDACSRTIQWACRAAASLQAPHAPWSALRSAMAACRMDALPFFLPFMMKLVSSKGSTAGTTSTRMSGLKKESKGLHAPALVRLRRCSSSPAAAPARRGQADVEERKEHAGHHLGGGKYTSARARHVMHCSTYPLRQRCPAEHVWYSHQEASLGLQAAISREHRLAQRQGIRGAQTRQR